MPFSLTVEFYEPRRGYRIRLRDIAQDIKLMVPRSRFDAEKVDSTKPSRRGEQIAREWGQAEKTRRERARVDQPRRQMTLPQIFDLIEKRNPDGVLPITFTKSRASLAHLVRIIEAPPDEIDHATAADYIAARREDEPQPAARTIKNEVTLLRQILQWGYEWKGETGMREFRLIRLPRIRPDEDSGIALTVPELTALLKAETKRADETKFAKKVVRLGVTTMLRRGPLFALRRSWIADGWLTVPRDMMKGKYGQARPLHVPLSKWSLEVIGEGSGDLVFPSSVTGDAVTTARVSLNRLAAAAKVREFSPHDLRRTGYTLLGERGVPRLERKILMGHSAGIDALDFVYDKNFRERLIAAVAHWDALRAEIET